MMKKLRKAFNKDGSIHKMIYPNGSRRYWINGIEVADDFYRGQIGGKFNNRCADKNRTLFPTRLASFIGGPRFSSTTVNADTILGWDDNIHAGGSIIGQYISVDDNGNMTLDYGRGTPIGRITAIQRNINNTGNREDIITIAMGVL